MSEYEWREGTTHLYVDGISMGYVFGIRMGDMFGETKGWVFRCRSLVRLSEPYATLEEAKAALIAAYEENVK